MRYFLVGLVAALAAPASSTFVVQCTSRLFDQRADPVINPGTASGHGKITAETISGLQLNQQSTPLVVAMDSIST